MGNVEMHDLAPVRDDERKALDLSRKVSYKQYKKHMNGDINENCLTELPWSVRDAVSLYEKMDVSFNALTEIPVELPLRLPHLNHIDLSYNKLVHLPESVGFLFHLKTVILCHNRISHLPESFIHLVNLKKLDISFNVFRELPQDLGQMESLEKLNVSNNKLKHLPISLGTSKTLTVIVAVNNRLVFPSQSTCNEGSEATLRFLRNNQPNGIATPVKRSINDFPRIRGNQLQTSVANPLSAQTQYIQKQTHTTNTPSRIKTPLLPPLEATCLDALDLRNSIIGLIYGAAIGDAIGIATENLSPDECSFHYDRENLTFADIIRDQHRVRWRRGDWTVHFDQMMLILDSIIHWAGVVDELDFAKRLHTWSNNGFKELGDSDGFVVSNTITKVVNSSQFLSGPHATARQLLEKIDPIDDQELYTDNGAICRSLILGIPKFHDLEEVVANAVRICKSTHADPRCVASAVFVSVMVALIMQGKHSLKTTSGVENLISDSKSWALPYLNNNAVYISQLQQTLETQDLASVNVHEEGMISHCYKPLSAAVAVLRQVNQDFRCSVVELAMLGGNSTANVCLSAALIGARTGYTHLPIEWVEGLRQKQTDWLNTKINTLLDMIGLP